MKINKIFVVLAIIIMAGCSKSSTPSAADITTQQLTAVSAWKIQSVSIGGSDGTADFTNFSLTFTANGFTSTNGGPLWPGSGTWAFDDASAKAFTRNDDVDVAITEISDSNLKLTLTWANDTFGTGRLGSVSGVYVFSFTK